jgi:anaerobic magnesium-protoporphyrin IX monomethyl ester cyclase
MNILLLNPPHTAIGSRLAGEHLPPLGLLSIGGPLIDNGYKVSLLDADYENLKYNVIVERSLAYQPDFILMGHSGSSSAQPFIDEIAKLLKAKNKSIEIIIGGVFPTFHWKEILEKNQYIDYIVCGEGEQVTLDLLNALKQKGHLENVKGIAYRQTGEAKKNPSAELIYHLDNYRVGWELMQGYNYTYWGKKKAVVIQFSRGCPHSCSYCGQNLFWKKWRHRDPKLLADEIEMLNKKYGVQVINFADENPSANAKAWKEFLEHLIEKDLNLTLVGSIRADNIVRDEKHLHLYKKAGFERFLLGIENYNEKVLERLKKAGSISKDQQAIKLLRKHKILSMATYVVGFGEETGKDFFKSLKHMLKYDPDQIQLLYSTPHKWTPYFEEVKNKPIIQFDQTKWDYKHQVIETSNLKPWQVILYVKLIEVIMQARPKAIFRRLFLKEKRLRKAMTWYNKIGKKVWFYELFEFFFKNKGVPELIKNTLVKNLKVTNYQILIKKECQ